MEYNECKLAEDQLLNMLAEINSNDESHDPEQDSKWSRHKILIDNRLLLVFFLLKQKKTQASGPLFFFWITFKKKN